MAAKKATKKKTKKRVSRAAGQKAGRASSSAKAQPVVTSPPPPAARYSRQELAEVEAKMFDFEPANTSLTPVMQDSMVGPTFREVPDPNSLTNMRVKLNQLEMQIQVVCRKINEMQQDLMATKHYAHTAYQNLNMTEM